MKLEIENYWAGKEISEYKSTQIKRHAQYVSKKRGVAQYNRVYQLTEKYFSPANNWLCLGSRNNWEKDAFSKLAGSECLTESLDIAPASKADYIMDINNPVPAEFLEKWDVVYTNALDHAIEAGNTLLNWMTTLKKNGVFLLHWSSYPSVSKADCCAFSYAQSIKFFEYHNIKVLYDSVAEFGDELGPKASNKKESGLEGLGLFALSFQI
jgi:hypothetical protein